MLPAERQRAILQHLNERGSIRVKELSRMFSVTEETVRRDLHILEMEGKLRRSHGGAVRVDDDTPAETSYLVRESEHVPEKMAIARIALTYVEPGDSIILDASSTALHVANALPNVPLTVLTNSLKIALELASKDKIEVISTGGILRASSLSYVGPMAEETIERFHVNKAFLSCKGVHVDHGFTESNALQARVKRKMAEIADTLILLADHSKIQVRDFTKVGDVDEIDVLITDVDTSDEDVRRFEAVGVKVVRAEKD
ncbi:DeoR/GlpR family DNA-binding transcription regulator [Alicyclobacillus mali (ex Roth et al. 2021)]|uniref:DeoR/GlpR family DNA-binding transcription regulator n=1 Tax=Alicyclobacillus mali (ex Roth et al. 2021) TaxID=1123961 RepID=UPI00082D7364|nr:DeoR/GlpR family DNA-binding transcription regulator [Alicyclobacillus mali (ex Roth et al. 2021)]